MRIRYALQRDPEPRIKAERRAIPIVIPLRARSGQLRRPQTCVHQPQLLIAHLAMIVPFGLVNELHRLVCIHFVDVCGGGTDMGLSELDSVSAVSGEVRWDADWDRFASSEVEHLGGDSDEWLRPFEVATVVVDIFDQPMRLAVERVDAMGSLHGCGELAIKLFGEGKLVVVWRCASRWILRTEVRCRTIKVKNATTHPEWQNNEWENLIDYLLTLLRRFR